MKSTVTVVATEKNCTEELVMNKAKAEVKSERSGAKAIDQDELYADASAELGFAVLPFALVLVWDASSRRIDGSRADASDGKPGGVECFSMAARMDGKRCGCGAAETLVESST